MSVKFIRIDDRLIHGQIVTKWAKRKNVSKIWIIDDGVAADSFISGVMKMVAPSNTELIITGVDKIPEVLADLENDKENSLILVKFPWVAKKVFEVGMELQELNVGGMGAGPGRSQLYKNISASEEEKQTLQEIKDMGVKVYLQVVPDDREVEFKL